MSDLDKEVLTHHAAGKLGCKGRPLVVVQKVLGDSRPLRLPVRPDAHRAVVDVVSADDNVDRRVHLDARNLGAAQLHHIVDVMDVVVLNDAEDTSHSADDAALLAVVDVAAADDVASHLLLQPPVVLSPAHGIPLHLGRALHMVSGEEVVVVRVKIFAEGDAGALTAPDLAVLDDPSLCPVGPDHAVLVGCRRRPGRRSLVDVESGHGDPGDPVLPGQKALPADRDLNPLLCGIVSPEVRIDQRLIPLRILAGVPLLPRGLRIPAVRAHIAPLTGLQAVCLIQRRIVLPDAPGVLIPLCKEPVAVDIGRIGVVVPKGAVRNPCHVQMLRDLLPVLDGLCPRDHGTQRLCALIGDAGIFPPRV